MNPVGGLMIVLGILLIIIGVKGSYKNITKSLKKL